MPTSLGVSKDKGESVWRDAGGTLKGAKQKRMRGVLESLSETCREEVKAP